MATASLSITRPSSVKYFYGRITREEAETILRGRGSVNGSYLLRESINPLGDYVISIWHKDSCHHYTIKKQINGMFMIPEGRPFPGPIELLEYYKLYPDGFVTRPCQACNRLPHQLPVAFRGMTYGDLENELVHKVKKIKGNVNEALGAKRDQLFKMVARELHLKMPWYHHKVGREDSEKRLNKNGHSDGKFLVRIRDDKKTYALTVSHHHHIKHYLIDLHEEKFGIEDGPRMECLMILIDHYHNKQDGLVCKLTVPCPVPGYDAAKLKKYLENSTERGFPETDTLTSIPPLTQRSSDPPMMQGLEPVSKHQPSVRPRQSIGNERPLPPVPNGDGGPPRIPAPPQPNYVTEEEGDDLDEPDFGNPVKQIHGLKLNAEQLEDVYVKIPRNERTFVLREDQIVVQDILGQGQFGSVCKGNCKLRSGKDIPVAIKSLKNSEIETGKEPDILKEARLMQTLDHKHIVRMIGVCHTDKIMLVLELAPLGPLHKFMILNSEMPQWNICELMWQVCLGMEYLESKKFVHRDLAARNVLLASEHFAKISDFGMSRTLERDKNYYEAQKSGSWPLKWYAPECIFYWKFDSKSDVWSFGVTLWEATSYGRKPYKGFKAQQLVDFLSDGNRLQKPERCPESVYSVMLTCWIENKEDRPNFKELSKVMEKVYHQVRDEGV